MHQKIYLNNKLSPAVLVITCHGRYSPQVLKRFSPFLQVSAKGNQIQHLLDFFVRLKENRNIRERDLLKRKDDYY